MFLFLFFFFWGGGGGGVGVAWNTLHSISNLSDQDHQLGFGISSICRQILLHSSYTKHNSSTTYTTKHLLLLKNTITISLSNDATKKCKKTWQFFLIRHLHVHICKWTVSHTCLVMLSLSTPFHGHFLTNRETTLNRARGNWGYTYCLEPAFELWTALLKYLCAVVKQNKQN